MEEIKITETETLMSDGSTSVHCEAMHDGQRIGAAYIVPPPAALPGCTALDFVHLGNGSYEQREERRARHRAVAHRAIVDKIATLAETDRRDQSLEERAAKNNVLGTPLGDHEHWIASGEIPGVPESGDDIFKSLTDCDA